ncbi:MAG: hypothetical protein PHW76_01540 [Alphaproteobacteria bacterium]|nr:hypothetical protein [Alphaproteobacteria bacterium]
MIHTLGGTFVGLIFLIFVVLPTARYYGAWMERHASQEKLQALQHQQLVKELVEPAKRVDALPNERVQTQKALYAPSPRIPAKLAGKITGYALEGWPMVGKTTVVLSGIEKLDLSQLDSIKTFIREQGNYLVCNHTASGTFRCLTKQNIDLVQAIVLNGAASVTADALDLYKDSEAQAKAAGRGLWK